MINSLVSSKKDYQLGHFELSEKDKKFANIVLVSFSAFDEDWILNSLNEKTLKIKYYYVGILEEENMPKNSSTLAKDFQRSLRLIKKNSRLSLWIKCMKMLEADPIFKEINITEIALNKFSNLNFFKKLSSGHKKVLLTITTLVQLVEECTLVFLDEPEGHLHPPLLSAFTRALSSLLLHRNGVAIIATHSPILLQEVPKNCVWIIRRHGNSMMCERPEIETFGENLGVLTQEIFGLEVTHSGFHQLLNESVNQHSTYEDVLNDFNENLGLEARAIIKSLFYNKDKRS